MGDEPIEERAAELEGSLGEIANQISAINHDGDIIYNNIDGAVHLYAEDERRAVEHFNEARVQYANYEGNSGEIRERLKNLLHAQEQIISESEPRRDSRNDTGNEIHAALSHNELKEENIRLQSGLREANAVIEMLIDSEGFRQPSSTCEEQEMRMEKMKQELAEAKSEITSLRKENSELQEKSRKLSDEKKLAERNEQKAVLGVVWTILDCIRTNQRMASHDFKEVLLYGNLDIRPTQREFQDIHET